VTVYVHVYVYAYDAEKKELVYLCNRKIERTNSPCDNPNQYTYKVYGCVYMYGRMYVCKNEVCMYACVYVCIYVCVYVCVCL